jgi:diguanylate cyclase (GGDEF)-like protein/PAS domain S-box-containing protein
MKQQRHHYPQVIQAEQVKLLYQHSAFALLAILLIAPILSIFLWRVVDSTLMGVWLAASLLVVLVRFALLRIFSHGSFPEEQTPLWRRWFIIGVLASGLLWGLAGVFLNPADDTTNWFLILFILTGLSGGALATLSSDRFAYAAFVLPALLPLAISAYSRGTPTDLAMGALVLLFIVLTLALSQQTYRFVTQSIKIRFDNHQLLEQLTQANELLGKVFDTTSVQYAHLDRDFNFIQVNQAYANAHGHSPDYFTGKHYFDLFPDSDELNIFRQVAQSGQSYSIQATSTQEAGQDKTYWDWNLQPIINEGRQLDGLLLSRIDVTEQTIAQRALAEKEEYLRSIMGTVVDAIITADEKGNIETANAAVEQVFGYTPETLVGQDIGMLLSPEDRPNHTAALQRFVQSHAPKLKGRKLTGTAQKADGSTFPMEVALSEARIGKRRIFTAVMRDVSEEKALVHNLKDKNRELEYLSSHDVLTGLYNRRTADAQLAQEWGRAVRNKTELTILIIDVDYFKAYNDTYGHQSGDKCLRQLAETMAAQLRRPPDFLARYGGEEFIAILPETTLDGACQVAERVRAAVEALALPHEKSQSAACVTISIGASSIQPSSDNRFEMVVSGADEALYTAKQQGRNRVCCQGVVPEYS